ncbi:MAG: DNA polymerase III subunit beta [Bacillota bacterium]
MHFTIARDKLAWLLQTASRPIPTRTSLPSLKGCLIEALSENVIFAGTNLDWGVKVSAEADVFSSGSLVVSAKILEDIVRTLSVPEVTLSLEESAWALAVKAGTSEIVLNALPANDFPKWPEPPQKELVALKDSVFRELVRVGSTFAVSNPARPLWGACLVDLLGDRIVVVSTDQFALSRAQIWADVPHGRAIVPANVLQDIARLKDVQDGDEIILELEDNHLYLSSKNFSSFTRLIEGQYYAYDQVIPKSCASTARIGTQELIGAASRGAIVASEENKAVRLILSNGDQTLTVKASSPEKGRMEEVLPAVVTGEDVEIWVQHRYVLQALSKISDEEVTLGMTGQVSPMVIEPLKNEAPADETVQATFVIMPMSPQGAF